MTKIDLPYYVVKKNGRAYWQPDKKLRQMGFRPRALGSAGPKAQAEAQRLYNDMKARKAGLIQGEEGPRFPEGSIGHAFERYKNTEAWAAKSVATRAKDWEWSWKFIEPVFGDVDPRTIEVEDVEALYKHIVKTRGVHTGFRVIKVWRALWKVMAAMRYCDQHADPSKVIARQTPKGRSATWEPGEIARLAKGAWRMGFHGLAAVLAVMWDTQFASNDVRTLRMKQRFRDKRGYFFVTNRGKTGVEVVGTLTKRGAWALDGYLARLGVALSPDAHIFRNRSGEAYTADTLGDDFRDVRAVVFPNDTRILIDIRRSGAVEALAGEADPAAMAAKMGNTIEKNRQLAETYLPRKAATVRLVDEARKRGRQRLRDE